MKIFDLRRRAVAALDQSMAAPHVSGMIAGILSVRGEFIGKPDELKPLILKSCTDLGREPGFQGYGPVDMMRTIQAI